MKLCRSNDDRRIAAIAAVEKVSLRFYGGK
jgi:hypothetical protein